MRKLLGELLVLVTLETGALCGVPMRPEVTCCFTRHQPKTSSN